MTGFLKILLVAAMIATLGALTFGLFNMFKEGKEANERSNRLMRLRILFQALAILIFCSFSFKGKIKMVLLTRIYTRGGDKGKTSLGTGKRVLKSSRRIMAIGDVDEANACIGVARLNADGEIDRLLSHIQNDLFDIGADLCVPQEEGEKERLRIDPQQVTFLEERIDYYNKPLPDLTSFVLPGGVPLSAMLHQARTVVRRAERTVCSLNEMETINIIIIHYMNRLSDLLFVLARYANHQKGGDILWVPGANR